MNIEKTQIPTGNMYVCIHFLGVILIAMSFYCQKEILSLQIQEIYSTEKIIKHNKRARWFGNEQAALEKGARLIEALEDWEFEKMKIINLGTKEAEDYFIMNPYKTEPNRPFVVIYGDVEEAKEQRDREVESLKKEYSYYEKQLSEEERLLATQKIQLENVINNRGKKVLFKILRYSFLCLGLLFSLLGLYLWYQRLQRWEDKIVQNKSLGRGVNAR